MYVYKKRQVQNSNMMEVKCYQEFAYFVVMFPNMKKEQIRNKSYFVAQSSVLMKRSVQW